VWDETQQSLGMRASVQIDEQVSDRFPNATAVYIIGDMTGHYWDDDSDLDLLIRALPEDLPSYREEARVASGHLMPNTKHRMNFFLISDETTPTSVSKHFGLLYDVSVGTWFGEKNWTTNELSRKSAIIPYVNWRLFKVKNSFELDPYDWKVLLDAFREIPEAEREGVVKALKGRVIRLESAISKHLQGEPKENWKLVERLEEELDDGVHELSSEYLDLPGPLIYSVLHTYRYDDLADTLDQIHETVSRHERTAAVRKRAAQDKVPVKDVPQIDSEERDSYWNQINSIANAVFQARGGFDNADKTMVSLVRYLFNHNQFLKTAQTRRDIVTELYNKYVRGSNDE